MRVICTLRKRRFANDSMASVIEMKSDNNNVFT